MMTNLSIKTKLIVAVSFLMISIIVAISYVTLSYFETKTKELIENEQFAKVSMFASEIDDKLINAHNQLIALSKSVPADLLQRPEKAQAFLDQHIELNKVFDNGIYLFDDSGVLVAAAPLTPSIIGRDFSFREYIATTLAAKKPYISDPYFSSMPPGDPSIMFTAPAFGPKGELIGVLGGSIDLLKDNIFSSLISMRVGNTGYFYTITKDRRILLHPVRSRILQQDVPIGSNVLLEKAIQGFEGTGETVTSRGLHAITSFKHMKAKDWLVAANFPIAEAYAPVYRAQKTLMIVTASTILLVPVIVWYLMNLLTTPLLAFTRHVESTPELRGEARLFPVASSDEIGKLTQAFNRMVTDLDRQQAEIAARQEEVEKLIGEVGEFNQEMETLMSERTMNLMALTVADRVRNPSSCIAGACRRLLAKGDVSDKQKDSIEIITDSASKLEAIVNDFQTLLKSKQSMFTYEDLNKIVEGVISVIKREADANGIKMIVNLSEGPLMINTQMNLLRIAVFHVIKNAIEATPKGGVVSVLTSKEAGRVTLVISDTGLGISKEILDRIFEPFFTTKERSFGMGLSLVKQVVSEHMGEINVESEEGRGTTFRIVFPERWKEK